MENKDDPKLTVAKNIVELLKESVFTVEGTPMATIKQNGQFKNKPLVGGAEFMLTDAYVGKRKQVIFIFSPVDAQEFTAEFDANKVDDAFPSFGPELAEASGVSGEKTATLLKKLIDAEMNDAEKRKARAAAEEADRLKKHYANNPNFGRF